MTLWLVVLAAGLITYATRLSFILVFDRQQMPAIILKALRFVPPAVLTAIIFPELVLRNGTIELSIGNYRLIAGFVAVIVAWRTRNVLLTILVGMGILWLLQAF